MAIKILVDSSSDISAEEAKAKGFELIPLIVSFGEEQFFDGVDLLPEQFFNRLIESDVLPTTSQINPYRFSEKLEELTADGSEVIVITLSSKLSGTYFSAVTAAEEFEHVYVVDSLNACIGERLVCELAHNLREQGFSAEEIVAELEEKKHRIQLIAVLDTLEYLKKGGRVSKSVAFAGDMLNIKPVLSVVDGEITILGKARGSKLGNNLLVQEVEKAGGVDFSKPVLLGYTGLSDALLLKYIEDSRPLWEQGLETVRYTTIGSVIGTHAGPGAIAAAFFKNSDL